LKKKPVSEQLTGFFFSPKIKNYFSRRAQRFISRSGRSVILFVAFVACTLSRSVEMLVGESATSRIKHSRSKIKNSRGERSVLFFAEGAA